MSHQVIFAWPHGGRSVSVAGSFSGWGFIPLTKQANYFFTSLTLGDGVYHYKFVVDGVWQYDLGQPHEDDGSGNWNNYIELGVESEPVYPGEPVVEHNAPVHHHQAHAHAHAHPHAHDHAPSAETEEEKPISKKQQKKQAKAQEKAQEKASKKEQQQQGGGGKKKGKPEPAPAEEAAPVEEEAAPAEGEEAAPVEEEEATPAGDEEEATPQVEAKPAKTAESVVVIDVVPSDVDTDMAALEAFVRSIAPEGLKWEGSSVSDYVFGLKKLTIICKCRDDVSVEDDVCRELEKNEELVGSAQIQSFAC